MKEAGSRMIGMTGFKMGQDRKSRTNVRKYSESYGREPLTEVYMMSKRKSIDTSDTKSQSFTAQRGSATGEHFRLNLTE